MIYIPREYPELRLAAAVINQAAIDLNDPNPLVALDALLWLFEDGATWLQLLGLEIEPDDLLNKIQTGSINVNANKAYSRKPGRDPGRSDRRNVTFSAYPIPELVK